MTPTRANTSCHNDHLAGEWAIEDKHTDPGDLANTQIDQGPGDSDSIDLRQDLEIHMFNKCHSGS